MKGADFERDLKNFSEETYNEIIKSCIEKETKITKLLKVSQIPMGTSNIFRKSN